MGNDLAIDSSGLAPHILTRRTGIAVVVLYPVMHFMAILFGLFLSSGSQTATLWISNAALFSVLVILGKRWWLPLLAGVLIAEGATVFFFVPHLPFNVAAFFSAANLLEALVAALLLERLVRGRVDIFRLRDCILFIFVVATIAPALSGLVAGLGKVGLGDAAELFQFWQLWWTANVLGILLITTTVFAWAGTKRANWALLYSRRYELTALVVLFSALTLWIFGSEPGSVGTVLGFPYAVFPMLIWSTVRFGTGVSMALVLSTAIIAIINTDSGNGPYSISSYTLYQRVISLQMFLTAAAISALILGAAFAERRFALNFLQQSEDKFSKAFHASPDAIAIFTVADGRVMDVNDSFVDMTGYSRDDIDGATLQELNLGPLEQERRRSLMQAGSAERLVRTTSVVITKTGSARECEIAFDTTEIGGDLCAICILHDVSQTRAEEEKRRAVEASLMQARKMEAIGQLTGGIAHDFNNILFSMLGNTELAESHVTGLHDSQLQSYLKGIREAGTRARDLVAQLLTFSRNQPTNPVTVSISDAVDEVLRLLRPVFPSSLQINKCVATEGVRVRIDPVQLHQLILNLCINARDATNGGGTIDIAVDTCAGFDGCCSSCQLSFRGDFACLTIRDSGPGIAPENLEKIFDPFFTSKNVCEGAGLGLSVVHGVAHGHGGHIVVDGTPGRTSIAIYFPLMSGDEVYSSASQSSASPVSQVIALTGKVLLVDDEPAVRNVMAKMLEATGLDVTVSEGGVEALARFESDPQEFQLVITDQTMPDMTGLTLAQRVLQVRPDIPVILCSGYSRDIDERRATEMGISGYFQKPVEFPRLIAKISSVLEAC